MAKHLNITKEEISKVLVTYDLNHFEAYVEFNGHPIIFLKSYKWSDMKDNDEYQKYVKDWKIPVEFTKCALQMRTDELSKRYC